MRPTGSAGLARRICLWGLPGLTVLLAPANIGRSLALPIASSGWLIAATYPSAPATAPTTTTPAPASSLPFHKALTVRAQAARFFAGAAPPDWYKPSFVDQTWLPAPGLVVPRGSIRQGPQGPIVPSGVFPVDVPAGTNLYARSRFDVDAPTSARVIELRIGYADGFVAFLNGVELARRNVPLTPPDARPRSTHGGETERIFLPVPLPPPAIALQSRDNVLAVKIVPAVTRLAVDSNAPAGHIGLVISSGVRIVRGPYLIAPTDGALSVAWETDLPARGVVKIRRDDGHEQRQVRAGKAQLRQVVALTGLAPGRRYQYQVEVEASSPGDRAQSSPATFEAAPARDAPARFVVYGDMRAPGHAAHAQVVAGILRERPALVVNTGDLVATGGEESAWQRYFEITAPLGAITPVAPALGNHESYAGGSARSWALFGLESRSKLAASGYTSFDWGGLHFVILDSNRPDAAQKDWLSRDLASARKHRPRAIFAVCHDGPWSHGPHGGSRVMERELAPVLAAGGVDVLFSGHDHLYERGSAATAHGPLTYVVSGGGGAPLYNPTCQPVLPQPSGAGGSGPVAAIGGPLSGAPLPMPACPPSVMTIAKAHHYIVVEVDSRVVRMCPRLANGSPLEPCPEIPLRARAVASPGSRR